MRLQNTVLKRACAMKTHTAFSAIHNLCWNSCQCYAYWAAIGWIHPKLQGWAFREDMNPTNQISLTPPADVNPTNQIAFTPPAVNSYDRI